VAVRISKKLWTVRPASVFDLIAALYLGPDFSGHGRPPAGRCQRHSNLDPVTAWRFLATVATTSEILGGCVVIVASCEEGAGAASAVGQASAVHGVAQSRVEHYGRGSGAGVSRTAGHNWSRGYKTYRHSQVSGFVPALDRLAVPTARAGVLSNRTATLVTVRSPRATQ